eukprot:871301-Pleurochrysis_carterae.AAC.1
MSMLFIVCLLCLSSICVWVNAWAETSLQRQDCQLVVCFPLTGEAQAEEGGGEGSQRLGTGEPTKLMITPYAIRLYPHPCLQRRSTVRPDLNPDHDPNINSNLSASPSVEILEDECAAC